MIKICNLNKSMLSCFDNPYSLDYLKQHGIVFSNNLFRSHVILSTSSQTLRFNLVKKVFPFKKFITWTTEPRHDERQAGIIDENTIAMNVFTGDVFFHNLHFLGTYHNIYDLDLGINFLFPPQTPLTIEKLQAKKKFCIAVFAYRDPAKIKLYLNGKNIDLFEKRQQLTHFFYRHNRTDIAGNNWPEQFTVKEKSGYENQYEKWWIRKLDLLQDYKFNICFENTIHPYYCTEKIWHAITAGCLPIYWGKGTLIYETFPEQSFIDASLFESNEALLHYIENLLPEEHITRYNKCLETMHKACAFRASDTAYKTDVLDKLILKVYSLTNRNSAN